MFFCVSVCVDPCANNRLGLGWCVGSACVGVAASVGVRVDTRAFSDVAVSSIDVAVSSIDVVVSSIAAAVSSIDVVVSAKSVLVSAIVVDVPITDTDVI